MGGTVAGCDRPDETRGTGIVLESNSEAIVKVKISRRKMLEDVDRLT
jgi:hypothetical protein